MRILVAGDSFAAQWPGEYPGWSTLLGNDYQVTNRAQAGVGEYKVWLQLAEENLDNYDLTIVCHTSAYRVYVQEHPFHKQGLHKNADLIYSDVMARKDYPERDHLQYYFESLFDLNYALDIHSLIKERIMYYTIDNPVIHLSFFPILDHEFVIKKELNFHDVWRQHPGTVNHLSATGNNIVYNTIKDHINETRISARHN